MFSLFQTPSCKYNLDNIERLVLQGGSKSADTLHTSSAVNANKYCSFLLSVSCGSLHNFQMPSHSHFGHPVVIILITPANPIIISNRNDFMINSLPFLVRLLLFPANRLALPCEFRNSGDSILIAFIRSSVICYSHSQNSTRCGAGHAPSYYSAW